MGKETKIKVVKNKVAPPFKVAEVEIMFGEGISQTGELVKIATDLDIIKKSGAWFSYNDEKIGQGSEKAKLYLKEHPEVFAEIDHKVREAFGLIEEKTVEAQAEDKSAPKTSKAKRSKSSRI
jgi:recombination protein RecA